MLLEEERVQTISSVQTLRIQTLSLPSMPSTFSNSIPSHQHLLAGFLQNRRSFCAIPTALLLARVSLPLISVRKRARARLQMTALLGSPARWPQRSSLLKPLKGRLVASYWEFRLYVWVARRLMKGFQLVHTPQSAFQSNAVLLSQSHHSFSDRKRCHPVSVALGLLLS